MVYPDASVSLPASSTDSEFVRNLGSLIRRLANDTPPRRVPSFANLSGVTLSPTAFEGMLSLDSLHIKTLEDFPKLNAKVFTGLRELSIEFRGHPPPDLRGGELSQLTNLRQVRIKGYLYTGNINEAPKGDDPRRVYDIPETLFQNNRELRSVHLPIGGYPSESSNFRIKIPHGIVAHLHHLESLTLTGESQAEGPQKPTAPVELAPNSPLAKYLIPPTQIPALWHLTKQHQDMTTWNFFSEGESNRIQLALFSGNALWINLEDE